jgi:uncharacterized membrane protein
MLLVGLYKRKVFFVDMRLIANKSHPVCAICYVEARHFNFHFNMAIFNLYVGLGMLMPIVILVVLAVFSS